jgi:methionyl-tRNA synthetase
MAKKFYVTTAIDYPSANPHVGHAYQKIVADVLFRWHKLLGDDVWFLTGTDEHGKKIQDAAEKSKKTPKKFVDELSKKFEESWKSLNIKPSRFIRTTDKDHKKLVQEIIKKCNKNGDIYLGEYEGFYCTNCEAYYTEKDLESNCCPVHKTKIEKLKEESYFFKLSKYQKFLLNLYKVHPEFIFPKERRNEIISRVKEGLNDLSISRTSFNWGIPFPLDKKHIVYVWFDALFNYLSGSGKNKKYWPADVHLLGKDNSWFHCVYWPAFLKSAGYKLPKTVFVHGFLKFNGEKISKSLGNVISPTYLSKKYGADSIRYFVCRQFPFGDDGDFSEKALIDRHNNELADKLGNLISRVSALIEKHGIEKTENKIKLEKRLIKSIEKGEAELRVNEEGRLYIHRRYKGSRKGRVSEVVAGTFLSEHPTSWLETIELFVEKDFKEYQFDKALNKIFALVDHCNWFVQNRKLWETDCKNREKNLDRLKISILKIAELLWPFIPESAEKIKKKFSAKKIKKGKILFKKIK